MNLVTTPQSEQRDYPVEPFFETSPYLLCIAGYDGYFCRINPTVSRLLGYSEEELMARPIREFIHPDDLDRTVEHRQALVEGQPLTDFENRYRTKDGQIIWLSWNSIPVENTQLIYAIATNITHIKMREHAHKEALANLSKDKDRLIHLNYRTAHDIRSPVATMISFIRLLEPEGYGSPEAVEIIETLQSTADAMEQTLDQSIDGLDDAHLAQLDLEWIPLREVIDTATHPIAFLMESTHTRLEFDFAAFQGVTFHRAYLESIFLNLITNSIKYHKPGEAPHITIRSKMVDGHPLIEVSDNGIGFDAQAKGAQVFGKHQKFHNHTDSHGIGLYLVHHQMTSLGGEVSVQSRVGEGACFTLKFNNLAPSEPE